jgi:hypothetical protein
MDDKELEQPEQESPQEERQESPVDNAGNVIQEAQNLGKKTVGTIRGLGAAPAEVPEETAAAGAATAEATTGATGAAAETGVATGATATSAGEAMAAATGTTSAAATAAGEAPAVATGLEAIAAAGSNMGMWALATTLIVVLILTFIIIFLGGATQFTGITPEPNPNPNPDDEFKIIYFTGGKAYISCDKFSMVKCPEFNLDSKITIYAIFYVDDTFPKDLINTAKISIGPFSRSLFDIFLNNVQPRPDASFLAPNYAWKLSTVLKNAEKGPDPNEYIISMGIGKPLSLSPKEGAKITLTLDGFPITDGGGGGGGGGGNSGDAYFGVDHEPTKDFCGRYTQEQANKILNGVTHAPFAQPIRLNPNWNYGDPVCSFKLAKLETVIKDELQKYHQDPNDTSLVNFWMDMQTCEGTAVSHDPPTPISNLGTWGLYQMSANSSAGSPWKKLSARGDVTWQRQVQNAFWWNYKNINGNFEYWESSYCLCTAARYKDKPFCQAIKRDGLAKTCQYCN